VGARRQGTLVGPGGRRKIPADHARARRRRLNGLWYALACVAAPAAWGGLMYLVFGFLRRRAGGAGADSRPPPADYSI